MYEIKARVSIFLDLRFEIATKSEVMMGRSIPRLKWYDYDDSKIIPLLLFVCSEESSIRYNSFSTYNIEKLIEKCRVLS